MITLGIETSCDETALALIETHGKDGDTNIRVIHSLVHSQAELHSAYGGVFPTLAKREHGRNLAPLLDKLIQESSIESVGTIPKETYDVVFKKYSDELLTRNPDLIHSLENSKFLLRVPKIDRIAVTEGPGLEPALWVGIIFAKFLSEIWNMPVVPVNHMEGHVLASLLPHDKALGATEKLFDAPLPALAFLISGGHTELVKMEKWGSYEIIGQTLDDAVGEAYDKTARLLGLPYPGGPHISKLTGEAIEKDIKSDVKLPRPMLASKDLNFSFSGLKTSVLYAIRDQGEITEEFRMGLARELQDAISETLDFKLRKAIEQTGATSLIIGGGVIANRFLRERFTMTAKEYNIPIFLPSPHVSGDNALMIALAGSLKEIEPNTVVRAQGTMRLK